MSRNWNELEINFLLEFYENEYTADLAFALGRSKSSVFQMATKLGLRKSAEFRQELGRITAKTPGSRNAGFKPGHIPANKGKKMPPETRAKCAKSWFKNGALPHNTRHDGALSKRDGYWYIRLSLGKWRQYHTWLWETNNRPIKPGEMVKFKDGNRDNVTLDNLYLCDRHTNMKHNTLHRYPTELKQAIRAVAKLNRTIQENEK